MTPDSAGSARLAVDVVQGVDQIQGCRLGQGVVNRLALPTGFDQTLIPQNGQVLRQG